MKRLAAAVLLSASLAACGGGGSGASLTPAAAPGSSITPKVGTGGGAPLVYVGAFSVLDAVNEETLQLVSSQNKDGGCPTNTIDAMVMSPDGTSLYVRGFAPGSFPNEPITQFNAASTSQVGQFTFPTTGGLNVSTDGARLMAGYSGTTGVFAQLFTVATQQLTTISFPSSDNVAGMPVEDPATHVLYVLGDQYIGNGQNQGAIYTITPGSTSPTLAYAGSAANGFGQMAFSPDGSTLYVTNYTGGANPISIVALDPATFSIKFTMTSPTPMSDFVVSPDGRYIYANAQSYVDQFDASTGTLLNRYDVTKYQTVNGYENMAISGDGSQVFLVGAAYATVNLVAVSTVTGLVRETTLTYPSGYVRPFALVAAQ